MRLLRCSAIAILLFTGCRIGFDGVQPGRDATASGDARDADLVQPIDAAPGTLLPTVVADTYVRGTDTTPNGAETGLQVGRYTGSGTNLVTLITFDLAGIAATSASNATLRLYQSASMGTQSFAVEIYRITQQWDEVIADWNNATSTTTWTTPGGTTTSTVYATTAVPFSTPGYYDWDVTALVNEWLMGTPNFGLQAYYATQPAPGNWVVFASKEAPAGQQPQLLVTP